MKKLETKIVVHFPNSTNPRWLIRKDRVAKFWQILPVNGLRGFAKRHYLKFAFPSLQFMYYSASEKLGSADFVYLGVDDGKRTKISIKLHNNSLMIEKSCTDTDATKYLEKEAEILKILQTDSGINFPKYIFFESGVLQYQGAIPKSGFNPKYKDHREKLVRALARLYRNFPITHDQDGDLVCLSHGDLNKWNMFIETSGELHVFDFETMREAPLGFDLATSYKGDLSHAMFLRFLREDLIALTTELKLSDFNIDAQLDKIIKEI